MTLADASKRLGQHLGTTLIVVEVALGVGQMLDIGFGEAPFDEPVSGACRQHEQALELELELLLDAWAEIPNFSIKYSIL